MYFSHLGNDTGGFRGQEFIVVFRVHDDIVYYIEHDNMVCFIIQLIFIILQGMI